MLRVSLTGKMSWGTIGVNDDCDIRKSDRQESTMQKQLAQKACRDSGRLDEQMFSSKQLGIKCFTVREMRRK